MIAMMTMRLKPALLFALMLAAAPLPAQDVQPDYITLTLDEAIQIALLNGFAMQAAQLELADAEARVREGIGTVLPNVSLNSGYTRNLVTANPFAGSSAGTLFSSFGYLGWLAYNEDARTDGDPSTVVLTFDDYNDRIEQGLKDAGLTLDFSDNPFAVANQFQNTVTVSQTLVNLGDFQNISGLKYLSASLSSALDREQQLVVSEVRQAFYQALLLQEQARVAAQSVDRTRITAREAARLVAQGVAPKVQRLGAEVQLANLETQLVQTRNRALDAVDNLKLVLGIPIEQRVRLSGQLEADFDTSYLTVSESSAAERAIELRPDLQQLQALRDLARVRLGAEQGRRLPSLSAIASLGYIGSVPYNRSFGRPDGDDPFKFTKTTNGFFSRAYWQGSISVGVNLQWNLFEGFARRARRQQLQIQLHRAELEIFRATQGVRVEVGSALRNLQTARSQIISQQQNVSNAELNYSYTKARLSEGVGTPLEERDASMQLDQSRINYLQAVFDFLMAQSTFETAVGIPLVDQSDLQLTSNRTR